MNEYQPPAAYPPYGAPATDPYREATIAEYRRRAQERAGLAAPLDPAQAAAVMAEQLGQQPAQYVAQPAAPAAPVAQPFNYGAYAQPAPPPQAFTEDQRQAEIAAARARAQAAAPAFDPAAAAAAAAQQIRANPVNPLPLDDAITAGMSAYGADPALGNPMPAEAIYEQMLAMIKAQDAQLRQVLAQVGTLQAQVQRGQAAAGAALGEPFPVRYARGARDKLLSHALAHPDLGGVRLTPADPATGSPGYVATGHFAGVLADAEKFVIAAEEFVAGLGEGQAVKDAAAKVVRFMERTHKRQTTKHVDFSAAIDDAESAVDAIDELAAA